MASKHLTGKRATALLAAFAMVVALFPATAFAGTASATTLAAGSTAKATTTGSAAGTQIAVDTQNTFTTQVIKKTLKAIYSYDSVSEQLAKSTKVAKVGTYALTLKNGAGILKFTAPKTKTYTFKFSNLKSSKASSVACVAGFCKVSSSSYAYKTIKTNEGKRPRAPFVSANLANGTSTILDGYSYQRLSTRTVKLKLTAGSSIYIAMQAKNMSDDLVPSTARIKIA